MKKNDNAAKQLPNRSEQDLRRANSDDDLLTERQAHEEELPMSLAWYRRMRLLGSGGPPFVRVSNRVFYRRRDLRAWVANQEVR
jgi:hypothetical protein